MAQNYLSMCMIQRLKKKVVEIKILVINLIYRMFFEYAKWQHDIGHYKLVISCMIVTFAYVIQSTNEKYNQQNTYSIHSLCDDIIMTPSFASKVLCSLSNTITSHFSCKCHLQLKICCKL